MQQVKEKRKCVISKQVMEGDKIKQAAGIVLRVTESFAYKLIQTGNWEFTSKSKLDRFKKMEKRVQNNIDFLSRLGIKINNDYEVMKGSEKLGNVSYSKTSGKVYAGNIEEIGKKKKFPKIIETTEWKKGKRKVIKSVLDDKVKISVPRLIVALEQRDL